MEMLYTSLGIPIKTFHSSATMQFPFHWMKMMTMYMMMVEQKDDRECGFLDDQTKAVLPTQTRAQDSY